MLTVLVFRLTGFETWSNSQDNEERRVDASL
jgi:hypothetical protein